MTMTRRNALLAGAASLPAATLLLGTARGQTPGQPGRQTLGEDPLLAACLLNDGRRQIEVCQFAKLRCQDEDVKAFAQAEIDEHEKVKADLGKFGYRPATPAAGSGAAAGGQPVQQAGAFVPQGNLVSVGRVTLAPGVSQLVTIESEVVDACIASAKQWLTNKEQRGKLKLDKAFIGDQLHAHHGLLDKVTVFKKHATPEVMPVLDQGEQIIRQHIATCERIMEKLEAMKDGQGAGGSDRRADDK
jgi:hypothetical protein